MKIENLIFLFLSFFTLSAKAQSICGRLNISSVNNEQLSNFIFSNDLVNNFKFSRKQCGLPGETLLICSSCSTETTEEMMSYLRPILGEKTHMAWHFNWHADRANAEIPKKEFSGEDFFYMHRLMIKMVQIELSAKGLPCIAPWDELPLNDRKNSELLSVYKRQLLKFRNPEYLSQISLNRLGVVIEPTLHLNLHNYYRGLSICSKEAKAQGFCDDLVPNDTSPLNKNFWKLHGLIDGLIGDWLKANNFNEIAVDCGGRAQCYQWKGTWIGEYPKT